ncbi:axonemal dynein light intermediate polypeptide 1-like isoform X1 [Nerophis ophidion]|uniref:axonemal dynein light intermediate polypeptide 1-like isoform X1 n=1 Tax=Nerophis ophidion TaxID=159077 RepID=UPI002ADEFF4C|nr:axonemal dynein light intermediate polypeptide 1-like isoform X1 [Nerophis ophidion]XP_061731351.1 axonemal dynein light intermediate polypeptide 1-like isoform X1 [Nerophis ophidion]
MDVPEETLLKYDCPLVVPRTADKKAAKRPKTPLKSKTPQPTGSSVPRPRKSITATLEDLKQKNEDILTLMFAPRRWMEGNQEWFQKVSSAPSTRVDVVNLEEELDRKLVQLHSMETGICPVRRRLYTQCFDELIRQVVLIGAERGLLLLRVRDEIQMTIAAYQKFYESSMVFGMRKALHNEQDKAALEEKICDLENLKEELLEQLKQQKSKRVEVAKMAVEKKQVQESVHTEQIQLLRKTNQQLKVQLEVALTAKK